MVEAMFADALASVDAVQRDAKRKREQIADERRLEQERAEADGQQLLNAQRDNDVSLRRAFYLRLREQAIREWRTRYRGRWQTPLGAQHRCSCTAASACRIVHLEVRYYGDTDYLCVDNGCCACRRTPPTTPADDDERRASLPLHRGSFQVINDTYVCQLTGFGHICNRAITALACPMLPNNYSAGDVCAISGLCLSSGTLVDEFWKPHKMHDADADTKGRGGSIALAIAAAKLRYETSEACSAQYVQRSKALVAVDDGIIKRLLAQRIHTKQTRADYFATGAKLIVARLFSKERFRRTAEVNRRATVRVYESTERYMSMPSSSSSDRMPTLVEGLHYMYSTRSNTPLQQMLDVSDEVRTQIIEAYGLKCFLMWVILRTRTRAYAGGSNAGGGGAKQKAGKLATVPFHDFVLTCMYVFQSGVRGIMAADDFLRMFLPSEAHIEDGGGESDTRFASTMAFTRIKTRIIDTMLHAVNVDGLMPDLMTPVSLAYADVCSDDLPGTMLTPYTKQKKPRIPRVPGAKRRRRH